MGRSFSCCSNVRPSTDMASLDMRLMCLLVWILVAHKPLRAYARHWDIFELYDFIIRQEMGKVLNFQDPCPEGSHCLNASAKDILSVFPLVRITTSSIVVLQIWSWNELTDKIISVLRITTQRDYSEPRWTREVYGTRWRVWKHSQC